ncbi:MAG: hypothetical protein LUQ16_06935 [Methanomassiliicoccales archaeon]|jgi:hypothetical protein|nr:hypothetical protein [Methanomassiliicoccales archaeon]MDD1756821.1 hypothetical protein [Methanomassiliicoccales archaeon]
MFEVNSTEAQVPPLELKEVKPEDITKSGTKKRSKPRSKAKTFQELQKLLSKWRPSDNKASRRMLSSEIMQKLDDNEFSFIKACIPSIIVEEQYPIDLMHYRSDQDIYEFLTRMLWMHQEYGSALGILVGVEDEEVSAKIEDACGSLLSSENDCFVFLV